MVSRDDFIGNMTTPLPQVCPAGWDQGAPTIKPEPVASLEYFDKVN